MRGVKRGLEGFEFVKGKGRYSFLIRRAGIV